MGKIICMYILISNNVVLQGPREWSRRVFERTIADELGMSVDLPSNYDSTVPINISGSMATILRVRFLPEPVYDSRTHILDGPYWEFTSTEAVGRYEPRPKSVEAIKGEMRSEVAHNRWVREVSGTTATIQGVTVNLSTQRGDRDIYAQAFLLQADGKTWKFDNNIWLTLTVQELGQIVNAVANHVSAAFVWEAGLNAAIDAAVTVDQLLEIDTKWPQNTP